MTGRGPPSTRCRRPHLPELAGVGREGRRTPGRSRDHAAARSGASAPSSLVVVIIGGGGAPAAAVSGRGGSGDRQRRRCNDIGFGVSCLHVWCLCKNVPITTCCGTTCQAQSCLFLFLAGIVPNFFLTTKVPHFFLAAKTTFGSWHAGTRGIHTGFNFFDSEKRLWLNSATKIKSWHDLCQK
jgi:hypothetical protein